MTEEQTEKLGNYLEDEKIHVLFYNVEKGIRFLEIEGFISLKNLSAVSNIIEIDDIVVEAKRNIEGTIVLSICWKEI